MRGSAPMMFDFETEPQRAPSHSCPEPCSAFRVIVADPPWEYDGGFRYRQTLVWHKADPAPLTGSVTSNGAEFLLVAVRGNPPCKKRLPSAVIKLPMTKKHSKKPVEWQWLIEQTEDGPRLELFARRKRPGWHVWGNEIANDAEKPNDRTQRRRATEQPHQPEAAPRRPLE